MALIKDSVKDLPLISVPVGVPFLDLSSLESVECVALMRRAANDASVMLMPNSLRGADQPGSVAGGDAPATRRRGSLPAGQIATFSTFAPSEAGQVGSPQRRLSRLNVAGGSNLEDWTGCRVGSRQATRAVTETPSMSFIRTHPVDVRSHVKRYR